MTINNTDLLDDLVEATIVDMLAKASHKLDGEDMTLILINALHVLIIGGVIKPTVQLELLAAYAIKVTTMHTTKDHSKN